MTDPLNGNCRRCQTADWCCFLRSAGTLTGKLAIYTIKSAQREKLLNGL